jgi:hypothetical protein
MAKKNELIIEETAPEVCLVSEAEVTEKLYIEKERALVRFNADLANKYNAFYTFVISLLTVEQAAEVAKKRIEVFGK